MQQGQGECAAGAFAQAQAELQQGLGAEGVEHQAVAVFARCVGKHAVVEDRRLQAGGDQQGAADDEAVDQQHLAQLGGLEHRARHHGDLEAAEGGQHGERIVGAGMLLHGGGDHLLLALDAVRRQARAGANALLQRQPGQLVHDRGGGGGVTDAHLPEADHGAGQVARQCHAMLQRVLELLARHRRLGGEVARTVGDFAVEQAGTHTEVVVDARIDHMQRTAILAGEHIDGGAVGQEVLDHLPGHVLRIGRYAFRHDTMVARKYQDGGIRDPDARRALDQAELDGQRFEASQAAERFGFVIDGIEECLRQGRIGSRRNMGKVHCRGDKVEKTRR